jgi:hypothetical protein
MSCQDKEGQNDKIKTANNISEYVVKFNIWGRPQEIKILRMNKSYIRGIPDTAWSTL